MKNIILKGFIYSMVLCVAACTDIPEYPDGRYTYEEIFGNNKKTAAYLNSCYNYLRSYGMSYGGSTFLAAFTDESHDANDVLAGAGKSWFEGNVTPYSNPIDGSAWTHYYEAIRRCNVFLANIDQAKVYYEDDRESWKAQAYALRAFYYFELIKCYGGVPITTAEYSVDFDYSTIRRASFGECVKQILADCDKALEAPDESFSWRSGTSEAERCTFHKGIVHAIKSQAALFAASPLWNDGTITWEDAARITQEAVDACEKNGYELFVSKPKPSDGHNAYDTYFYTRSDVERTKDKETIFEIRSQLSVSYDHGLPITEGSVRAGISPSQELVDCYETIDGEIPVLGYRDADHLVPILNPKAVSYNDADPYKNRDPRLIASIYYNGAPYILGENQVWIYEGSACFNSMTDPTRTRTGYYLRKYSNFKTNKNIGNQDGYFKMYRLATLYLNYAEAAAEACTGVVPEKAVQVVNKIRNRVGMPSIPTTISKEDFIQKVRNERRIELAFEESRFYDVRRWKILNQTDRVVTGMRAVKNEDGSFTYSRYVVNNQRKAFDDKFLLFPIPGDEVIRLKNKTGIDIQNPGW